MEFVFLDQPMTARFLVEKGEEVGRRAEETCKEEEMNCLRAFCVDIVLAISS